MEEYKRDDPELESARMGRGMIFGLLLGSLLWILIIGGVWAFLH